MGLVHIREYVKDGVNGILVKSGDTQQLRKAIERVTTDQALRERLAAGARESAYSLEEFCDEILSRATSPNPSKVRPASRSPYRSATEPSFLILHENDQMPWDLHRLNDLKYWITEQYGHRCEVLDLSLANNYEGALEAQQRINASVVIADKMPVASGYLHACRVQGASLPPNVIVTDYHMLGRVDLVQDEFNQGSNRNSLGKWWPSKRMQIVSPYPSFSPLYDRAGIPIEAIRWLPIPAPERDVDYGPVPSTCTTIVAGGRHLRDLDLFRRVLPELPREIRQKILFFGSDPGIDWSASEIQYTEFAEFPDFFKALQEARFVLAPVIDEQSSFGGVSFVDLARSAGKPIITTDLPATRGALGHHNSVLIPAGDADAFRAAILKCWKDDAYVDKLTANAAALYEANSSRWLAAHLVHMAGSWHQPMADR